MKYYRMNPLVNRLIFKSRKNTGISTSVIDVKGTIDISGHILPSTTLTYDLGSSTQRWRDIYLSGNTIDLGGTKITKDISSGGIKVMNVSGTTLGATFHDISINNLNLTGNIYQNGTLFTGGGGSQWTTSSSNIYYNTGNVGIGTTIVDNPFKVTKIQATNFGAVNVASITTIIGGVNVNTSCFDKIGNMYVGGYYQNNSSIPLKNFDTTNSIYSLPSTNTNDGFIVKYNALGVVQGFVVLIGTGTDAIVDMCTDNLNNLYVTGQYQSSGTITLNNFNQTASSSSLPLSSNTSAFVIKYNSSGILQGYSTIISSGNNFGKAICTDASNNIYYVGNYQNNASITLTNLDGINSSYSLPTVSTNNCFIIKYNSSGLIQGTSAFGGYGSNSCNGVCVDVSNNVYITGQYQIGGSYTIKNLDGTNSSYNLSIVDGGNLFAIKYSSTGVVSGIVNQGYSQGYGICVDSNNNIYIAGQGSGSNNAIKNFNGTSSSYNLPFFYGCLILKYNNVGTSEGYVISSGGNIYTIAVDTMDNLYIGGDDGTSQFTSNFNNITYTYTPGPNNRGTTYGFYGKISPSGELKTIVQIPAYISNRVNKIVLDGSNNALIAGTTSNYYSGETLPITNLDGTSSGLSLITSNTYLGFIIKYNNLIKITYYNTVIDNNGNLGIGSLIPAQKLDVSGNVNISGNIYSNGVQYISSQWTTLNNKLYYNGGNVGIGISNPNKQLDISGNLNVSGIMYQNNNPITPFNTTITSMLNPVTSITGWGQADFGQLNVPAGLTDAIKISAGGYFSVALKRDGTVVAWGGSYNNVLSIPANLSSVTDIAAGQDFVIALKSDGTVVGWGNTSVPGNLSGVIKIFAGVMAYAIKSDNSIVEWGGQYYGWVSVPTGFTDIISIASGQNFVVALRSNGQVLSWGTYAPSIPNGTIVNTPPGTNYQYGLSNIVSIAAGNSFGMAITSDGNVITWGGTFDGINNQPANLNNVIAIAGGQGFAVALKSNSTVAVWGNNSWGQQNIPNGLSNVIAISSLCTCNFILSLSGTYTNYKLLDVSGTSISMLGNVGIGTSNPGSTLDVSGNLNVTGNIYQNGILFTGGGSSQWTTSGNNVYYNSGNVGIGTSNPGSTLDVSGNINFNGNLYQNNVLFSGSQWTSSGNKIYYNTGNIGIGSSNPYQQLDVVGNISLTGNIYQNGVILTGGGGGSSQWTTIGSKIYYNTGNVGIGSSNPATTLDVSGNINFNGNLYKNGVVYKESQWTTNGNKIYFNTGNVGIGTGNASNTLDVSGNITTNTITFNQSTGVPPMIVNSTSLVSNLNVEFLDNKLGAYYLDYTNLNNKPNFVNSQWTSTGSDIYYNSGFIGIGTNVPLQTVHVNGNLLQTSSDMQIIRNAYHASGLTNGTGRYIGSIINWTNISNSDQDAFRISGRCHVIYSDTEYAYRRFDVLVTPKSDVSNNKPKLLFVTEGNNYVTNGFNGNVLDTTVIRDSNTSVQLKVTWDTTLTNYKASLQIEVFALKTLGVFNFTGINS